MQEQLPKELAVRRGLAGVGTRTAAAQLALPTSTRAARRLPAAAADAAALAATAAALSVAAAIPTAPTSAAQSATALARPPPSALPW